jgi:hypothetical protein
MTGMLGELEKGRVKILTFVMFFLSPSILFRGCYKTSLSGAGSSGKGEAAALPNTRRSL